MSDCQHLNVLGKWEQGDPSSTAGALVYRCMKCGERYRPHHPKERAMTPDWQKIRELEDSLKIAEEINTKLRAELASARAQVELTEAEPEFSYANGLELTEVGADGWSVFTGCDGEDPRLVGFFLRKDAAELLFTVTDPDEPETLIYPQDGNTSIELAVLTKYGIITANDIEIDSHAQLRAKIAASELPNEAYTAPHGAFWFVSTGMGR